MSVRKSQPVVVHHVWNAIENCSSQRQQPNFERVSRHMMRYVSFTPEEIERELEKMVQDGLVLFVQRLGFKGSKKGEEQELYKLPKAPPKPGSHDWYCSTCHLPGKLLACTRCSSVHHSSCLTDAQRQPPFVCPQCQISSSEKCDIKKNSLNTLLGYTIIRLKARMLPMMAAEAGVLSPSADPELKFRSEFLLHRPMEIYDIEDKLDRQVYSKLADFEADVRLVAHNIFVMNGADSEAAAVAAHVLQDCLYDLQQIGICRDCYRMSNEKHGKNWFCRPCRPAHQLVFAKQKGYPYWPSKVMKVENDMFDVRFFGEPHERAMVPRAQISPITTSLATLQIKRTAPWTRAYDELKRHQTQLEAAERDPSCQQSDDGEQDDADDETPTPAPPPPPPPPPAKRRRRAFEVEEDGVVEVKDCSIVVQKVEKDDTQRQCLPSPDDQVTSSCQEPQPRTVATQTPAKFLRATAQPHQPNSGAAEERARQLERELERELERVRQAHKQEVTALETQHRQALSGCKRKQWCFNCEQEAIYHCCWNTAYCSTECQQTHWHKEHKRVCRRKRTM